LPSSNFICISIPLFGLEIKITGRHTGGDDFVPQNSVRRNNVAVCR